MTHFKEKYLFFKKKYQQDLNEQRLFHLSSLFSPDTMQTSGQEFGSNN
jgi:hypothetical protein